MSRRLVNIVLIVILLGVAIWVDIPKEQPLKIGDFSRPGNLQLGLDLQGGLQVLLEADVAADAVVDAGQLETARQILENRANGLGVSEVVFQVAGDRRIMGEFPGLKNPEEVVATLKETGQLEFVDLGDEYLPDGTVLKTEQNTSATPADPQASAEPTLTTEETIVQTVEAGRTAVAQGTLVVPDAEATPQPAEATATPEKVYKTVMTGDKIKSISVTTDALGKYVVDFELKDDGTAIFADYTSKNVGKFLAIVLDKKIVSAPRVESAITEGRGQISGGQNGFSYEEANNLAITLRYGSLPIPLKVVETRVVGPTLGQDSLNKSILAGLIGFLLVILFMTIYYRLPGAIAILAIISYAVITLAVYKLIPVTLTLPGIAGFLLSTGGALDANILIFERLKEELRAGRTLKQAMDISWKRAWPSIRDSNIATLITSAILFWFGSAFGASMVKGFALTLALGVAISLFSAIVITRTYLGLAVDGLKITKTARWYGA